MADRRYPNRYRMNNRDPASFDAQWQRDQTLTFQLLAWDTSAVGDIFGGPNLVTATVRALPNQGATALLERQCAPDEPKAGWYSLAIAAADFPSLSFDLGQPYRCLWLDIRASITEEGGVDKVVPVFDGAGNAIFPLRVHQTMGVGA